MKFQSFDEFYLFYLTQHSKPKTKALHFFGIVVALLWLGTAMAFFSGPWWLLAVPIGYAFSWTAHLFVEGNRPATFGHPFYSLAGDFRMAFDILRHRSFSFSLVAVLAIGAARSPAVANSRAGDALTTEITDSAFRAKLKEGYHFNLKAPNGISIDGKTIRPSKIEAREAEFTKLPTERKSARASLYVCDDALTFCEPHTLELGPAGDPSVSAVSQVEPVQGVPGSGRVGIGAAKGKVGKHGFIENDLPQALSKAKTKGQLVLVDFSARWCPGCIRFDTETFPTKDFQRLTKDFVKVKIDVDRFENIVLSEKFRVKAIPTLLVMTSEQEEIDRLIDYQSQSVLSAFFSAIKIDATPIQILAAAASSDDSARNWRVGKRLLASQRPAEAVAFLAKVAPPPPELWTAKVDAAASVSTKDSKNTAAAQNYRQVLEQALAAEPDSVRSLAWRLNLAPLLSGADAGAKKEKLAAEGTLLADSLLASPAKMKQAIASEPVGEFSGYEKLLVASLRADLIEAGGAKQEAIKVARQQAGEIGLKLKIPITATGPSLRLLLTLLQAEMYEPADQLSSALLKQSPGDPELERRRVRVLLGLKKYDQAITLAIKALAHSYDRNEYFVAEALAKAYIGAGQAAKARELLDRYLARQDSEWSNIQSTRKSMESLRRTL